MTSDIQRRIFEHNSGLVKSTKNRRPFKLSIMNLLKLNLKPRLLRKN